METELEQEGNENAWRTADLRIRKTQVLSDLSCESSRFRPSLPRRLLLRNFRVVSSVTLSMCLCPSLTEMEHNHEQRTSSTRGQARIGKSQVAIKRYDDTIRR